MNCPYFVRYCSKCNSLLLVCSINFRKQKTGKYGFGSICKKCTSIKEKERHHKNKDKINKRHRDNYHKNIEKEHARSKAYYESHKEERLQKNKEYRQNNPNKVFNKQTRRRYKEQNLGTGISKEQWYELMQFFNWECAYSGEKLIKGKNRTIDHIIPLNNKGVNEIWNCVPMLYSYNSSKQDEEMLKWYKKQEFYTEERLNKIYEWQRYAYDKWCKEDTVNEQKEENM